MHSSMATPSSSLSRVLNPELRKRIMSADEAAALINHGDAIGMSGFTGSGYPKAFPQSPWPIGSAICKARRGRFA